MSDLSRYGADMLGSEGERHLETQLKRLGITGWVREYQFAPPKKWRFDFAWPDRKLAVEIEGGTWSAGRHSRGRGFAQDCEKYNTAVLAGWRVLRFTTGQVTSDECLPIIEAALAA